mmetsp:Transcript_6986/g.24418  ORF Transcript_6986/g.24418 Transcript_6986/m.24418 type:complete len:173 (+) Transcript_6986:259-777(+)
MQEVLVKMGDKPCKFLGSSDWIGSVEISILLDYFYSAPCRIIHRRNDEPWDPSITRSIMSHFAAVGSPIMLGGQGGGARTVLGICISEAEDAQVPRCLLLDPHYSGEDEIASLSRHSSRVCAWSTFDSICRQYGSFTNLCLPLLPVGVPGVLDDAPGHDDNSEWEMEVVDVG